MFIPGLLQTPAYLRALLDASLTVYSTDAVEEMAAIREARKRVIDEDGARFAAVIYEPALTAPMPSREAHREQLSHILFVAQRQNVSIQVLPMSEWRAAHMTSHFVMYSFGPEPAPEAVAFDSTTSTVILEEWPGMPRSLRRFALRRSLRRKA
ncbi:DUF5753 domain-containing protein [Streptomyces sp. F63]|uniref:DUF5753 domain-containing protein n=1 Tax=Streptomyces sp. F63 TaxID=2824887 RepID=UPI0027DDC98C|nr:DUF5753 domain-containing protein [Streptomyces sp. F63]